VVSVARSNRNLNEQLAEFRIYLFYLTGTAIIVMGILVFSISGVMLRPFKSIVTIADKINVSGSMDRLPVPTVRDETRLLSITLNNMLARIESSVITQLQFFDSATHELKTPLTIMKGQLSLTLTNTEDQAVKKMLTSTLEECERLERTISDFLLLSQLKNDNLLLRTSQNDLGEMVFTTLAGIKKFAGHKNVTFQVTQSDTHFPVNVDKDKIQTVIFNVLENAVFHSADGSVIKLNLGKQEHHFIIEVKNPISEPVKNFELLGRERYTSSTSVRGMGLGLWICSQILTLHHSELEIQELNSEFIVRIKLNELAN
jgi:signal transduction histidine kinase